MHAAYFTTEFCFEEPVLAQISEISPVFGFKLQHFAKEIADDLLFWPRAQVILEVNFHETRRIGYLLMEQTAIFWLKQDVRNIFIDDSITEIGHQQQKAQPRHHDFLYFFHILVLFIMIDFEKLSESSVLRD